MEWNDALIYRDIGWLVSWAKDAQESLDMMLVAYRVSEDHKVLLPHFVAIDGATVTHIASPVDPPSKEEVKEFLPQYKPLYPLDPAFGPVTKAQHVAPSLIGPEQRKVIDVAMKKARSVIEEYWKDYAMLVGRKYQPFMETEGMEDAKIALITMGAYAKDAVYVAKKLRKEGIKIGVVRLRYWRPFPTDDLRRVLKDVKAVGVIDFSYSFGSPDSTGAFFNDIRSALYESDSRPLLLDFIFVGGREPSLLHFEQASRLLDESARMGIVKKVAYWLTLRGEDI
jgi:pyruvate/2-oxoacid:ferredoxin oxidoreductase alpha subunit